MRGRSGTLRRLPQDARKHRRDSKSVYPQERVEVAQVMTDQIKGDMTLKEVPIPADQLASFQTGNLS